MLSGMAEKTVMFNGLERIDVSAMYWRAFGTFLFLFAGYFAVLVALYFLWKRIADRIESKCKRADQ
jgi:hypothetical protein